MTARRTTGRLCLAGMVYFHPNGQMQTIGQDIELRGAARTASFLAGLSLVDKVPLILASGVLLGFSSAGFGVWWLAWFALAPLIVLTFGCRGKLEAAFTGMLFGLSYHLVCLRWLLQLYPLNWFGLADWLGFVAAVQLWLLEAAHQSLLFLSFSLFLFVLPMRSGYLPFYKRPYFPFLFAAPLVWIFLQWSVAPAQSFLGIPIDQLAYSQSSQVQLIQIARFGGAVSLDFLIVLANCVLAALVMEFTGLTPPMVSRVDPLSPRSGALTDAVIAGVCVALCAFWGQSEVLRAAVMPAYWQWDDMLAQMAASSVSQIPQAADASNPTSGDPAGRLSVSGKAAGPDPDRAGTAGGVPVSSGVDTVSGANGAKLPAAGKPRALSPALLSPAARALYAPAVPIAVVQGNIGIDERTRSLSANEVADRYIDLCRDLGVGLIVLPEGVLGMNCSLKGPEALRGRLEQLACHEKKEVIAGSLEVLKEGRVDAVRLIGPGPQDGCLYVKNRLVPFAEAIPLGPIGQIVPEDLKNKLAGGTGGFAASASPALLHSIFGAIGATIACELVYPELAAEEVSKGASLLVNVCDLSYFHNSVLNQEILAAAVFRAVENGRYLVIAANNGISAVIDPCGIVTSASVSGQKGILLDRVQFLHKKTPFTRMWWLWTPVVR